MSIQQRIMAHLAEKAETLRIADVRIGLGYTAVMLENGNIGLACTPIRDAKAGCTVFDAKLPLTGRRAAELLSLITASYPISTAIGLATANALANRDAPEQTAGDILSFIRPTSSDHIGMVGHFAPMVGAIRQTGATLTIFEQIDRPEGDQIPTARIPERLPDCTIALITATSIINGTFDRIIESAANCRSVVVLGASTPLIRTPFEGTPVTCLSGVLVTRPEELLHIVSCGGGMRRFKSVIRKVNLAF